MNCWVCSEDATILKRGISINDVSPDNINITDKNYGHHLSIYICNKCGFKFCHEASKIKKLYDEMKDESYIDSEYPRILQAKKIITQLQKWKTGSNIRLLDVGAGAGILVKEASNEGFVSEGIEPSKYLTDIATKKNIKVNHGTLDDYKFDYKFDIVTCVDVIEHVSDPIRLLEGIFANLKENGIALIITPDVNSLMSKIMKWKWWHIRVAHIAYFNKKTLKIALDKTQFKAIYWSRPTWFFSIGYLIDRISVYFPFFEIFKKFKLVNKVIIPLNLRDSYSVIVRKKNR